MATITKRIYNRSKSLRIKPPRGLKVTKYGALAVGGPGVATLTITGRRQDLAPLIHWLGFHVELYNRRQTRVWWGKVYRIEVKDGAHTSGIDLDSVTNRVAVLYTDPTRPQGDQQGPQLTPWAESLESIEQYGLRESIIEGGSIGLIHALVRRNRELATHATSGQVPDLNSRDQQISIMLTCRGPFEQGRAQYYARAEGRHAYEATQTTGVALIGQGFTSNQLRFRPVGDTTTRADTNQILATSGTPFQGFQQGQYVRISGSAANNLTDIIEAVGGDGAWIRLGTSILVNEAAGATVTITTVGSQVAQTFTPATSWALDQLWVDVDLVEMPTDSFRVQLTTLAGGVPNTILATGLVDPITIAASDGAVLISIPTVQLVAGTTYALIMSRTGAFSSATYYQVRYATPATAEPLLVWDGSAWDLLPHAALPFVALGTLETSEQLRLMLGSLTNVLAVDQVPSSGSFTVQYRDGRTRTRDEIERLLAAGTIDLRRYLLSINAAGTAQVTVEPPITPRVYTLDRQGRVRDPYGNELAEGVLPVGVWLRRKGLLTTNGPSITVPGAAYFVESIEYDVPTGQLTNIGWRAQAPIY